MISASLLGRWPRLLASAMLALSLSTGSVLAEAPQPGPVNPFAVAPSESDVHFGVAEAYRNLPAAAQAGVTWDRIVFSWDYLQEDGPESWNPHYFPIHTLHELRDNGIQVVGLLQDTPEWARAWPEYGHTSPPIGLYEPWDSPGNTWARFVERMAREYRGVVDHWVIWNEPEFQPEDQGGLYVTWSGGAEDYYQLLKVAYQAARAANPEATVVFGATSYWIDISNGREQFLRRVLDQAAADPEPLEGGFFDAVALNIYWAPDDIWRVAEETRATLAAYGHERPLWITETNAMPYDDPLTPKSSNGQRVSLDVQTAYVIQAYALGIAAGFERIGWHAMTDRDTTDEVWGLSRDDGTLRPAYAAYQVAARYLSNAEAVTFAPLERRTGMWPPGGYYPNWQIYQVVFERQGQRVTVLWNADGEPRRVAIPRLGESGHVIDAAGKEVAASGTESEWRLDLAEATATGPADPEGYFFIGGTPLLVVEQGVPAGSPVNAPRLVR